MLTIWRCVSPSISDHIYRYGPIWTATIVAVAAPVALYINTPKAKSFLATHNSVTTWQLALPAA